MSSPDSQGFPRRPTLPRQARVLVVDDHILVRQGLAQLLDDHPRLSVAGTAASAEEALAQVAELEPDVVLLDLYLGAADGAAIIDEVRRVRPQVKIVILTMSDDDNDLLRTVMAGADGYVVKSTDFVSLVTSLEWVMAGEAGLSRTLTARLVSRLRDAALQPRDALGIDRSDSRARLERLSPRERDVLIHVARGESNRQIARELGLSEHTVRTHITNILAKLGFENRVQAATFAIQRELIAEADSAGEATRDESTTSPDAIG